jgi:Mor family transcriptional regulator
MLQGGKDPAPPAPRRPPEPKNALVRTSLRYRALRAILDWTRCIDGGTPISIEEVAKRHRLSKRKLLNVIRKDEMLQEQLFSPMLTEAKMGLQVGMQAGLEALMHGDTEDAAELRLKWTQFFAKVVGGMYQRRDAAPVLILQQLIPDLPAPMREIQARVIDMPVADSLTELLPREGE